MGATSTYELPYQELSDAPDGAALGQNLAEAVETELERVDASAADHETRLAAVEGRMQTGFVATPAASGSDLFALVDIVFPVPFSDVPVVVATCESPTTNFAVATNRTAAGCRIYVRDYRETQPGAGAVQWVAVGPVA